MPQSTSEAATPPRPAATRRTVLAAGIPSAAAVLGAIAVAGPRPARLGSPTGDRDLVDLLRPHLDGQHHVACALLEDGRPRFAGFGADAHTEFEIGSISKTFTAALLMDAAERDELDLKDTVGDLLAAHGPHDLAGRAEDARIADRTLTQLASHTAGMAPLPDRLMARANWTTLTRGDPYAGYTPDDLLEDALVAQSSAPGTHVYSNFSVALEGELTARAAAGVWPDLVATRLLEPFGLGETRIPTTAAALGSGAPRGLVASGQRAAAWVMDGMAPCGGVRSTAADLAHWVASMIDGSNPAADGLDPVADAGQGTQVAINWFLTTAGKDTIVWHNGATGGFHSFCGYVHGTGRGIVLLADVAQSGSSTLDRLGMQILSGKVA
jgi:CubicO group peptidase (beta-lactamase class C family)